MDRQPGVLSIVQYHLLISRLPLTENSVVRSSRFRLCKTRRSRQPARTVRGLNKSVKSDAMPNGELLIKGLAKSLGARTYGLMGCQTRASVSEGLRPVFPALHGGKVSPACVYEHPSSAASWRLCGQSLRTRTKARSLRTRDMERVTDDGRTFMTTKSVQFPPTPRDSTPVETRRSGG